MATHVVEMNVRAHSTSRCATLQPFSLGPAPPGKACHLTHAVAQTDGGQLTMDEAPRGMWSTHSADSIAAFRVDG